MVEVAVTSVQGGHREERLQKRITGCALRSTIAGDRRKKRLEEEGCDPDLSFVSGKQWGPGQSWDPEHSQAPHLRECLRGRRLRMPRMLERCWGISLENVSMLVAKS
ncbi:hypothetical protein B296_00019889 [Ensete ventricosum]|uniref:Uncharacterized protein n=1 Tax=Ensete ventricosum TaxID=4639 RepID=A0A426YTS6_ENSVE|nr:hypothetical protein B296_00019889 [Ensete ventricosum]